MKLREILGKGHQRRRANNARRTCQIFPVKNQFFPQVNIIQYKPHRQGDFVRQQSKEGRKICMCAILEFTTRNYRQVSKIQEVRHRLQLAVSLAK